MAESGIYLLAAIGAGTVASFIVVTAVFAVDLWRERQRVKQANVPARYYPRSAVTLQRDEEARVVVPFRVQ